MQQVLANHPREWVASLYKQFGPLAKLTASCAQIKGEVRHASKKQEKLNQLKAPFLASAKQKPDGVVLRLELYAPGLAHVGLCEGAVARAMATQAHAWAKEFSKELELQIAHTEMCPQRV